MRRLAPVALLLLVAAGPLAGCGSDGPEGGRGKAPPAADRDGSQPRGATGPAPSRKRPARPQLPPMACDPGLANCVVASGVVVYIEKNDPDGDGDAHFVTVSRDNVTGGGLTVFDVNPDLRPRPLPPVGSTVGGLGPVYTGSYGQRQIEVTEFHVARQQPDRDR